MLETSHRNALESGYRLHWYRIESVLGQGGFGITYLAHDLNIDGPVALKEYLPMELAVRDGDQAVHSASEHHNEQYRWGLQRFTDEARTLNRFDHPNIMRVHSVFEANNTAYMVMDYEEGESFEAMLCRHEKIDEERLVIITMALLDGLEVVHREGFIHRDIKPGNVYIRADGSPVLLDFGSARLALIEGTRTVTTVVSAGYAPLEQYSSRSSEQGPWTDIYSLGATLYRAVAGVKPVDAVDRIRGVLGSTRDVLPPASEVGRDRYSAGFLAAIDHALEIDEQERPQTIAGWRDELLGRSATLEVDGSHSSEQAAGTTADSVEDADESGSASTATQFKPPTQRPLMRTRSVAGISVALAVVALIAWWQWGPSSVSNRASGQVVDRQVMVEDQTIENGSRSKSPAVEKTEESHTLVQPLKPDGGLAPVATAPPKVRQETVSAEDAVTPEAVASRRAEETERRATELARQLEEERTRAELEKEQARAELEARKQAELEGQRLKEQEARLKAEQERQAKIDRFLEHADKDLNALRLSSPTGNNAFERYRSVLALDPDNEHAQDGLLKILERYLEFKDKALSKRNFDEAQSYVEKAEAVLPGSELLIAAKAELDAARAEHEATQAQLAAQENQRLEEESARAEAEAESPDKAQAEIEQLKTEQEALKQQLQPETQSQPGAPALATQSPAKQLPDASAPLKVAIFQSFSGRGQALDAEELLPRFAHRYIERNNSLDLTYSYYGKDFDEIGPNVKLWSGINKHLPMTNTVYSTGARLGADVVLMFYYTGVQEYTYELFEFEVFLFDIKMRRDYDGNGNQDNYKRVTESLFKDLLQSRKGTSAPSVRSAASAGRESDQPAKAQAELEGLKAEQEKIERLDEEVGNRKDNRVVTESVQTAAAAADEQVNRQAPRASQPPAEESSAIAGVRETLRVGSATPLPAEPMVGTSQRPPFKIAILPFGTPPCNWHICAATQELMLDAINRVLVHFSELTVIYSYYDRYEEPLPTGQFDGLWTGGFVNPELSNRRALQIADSLGADIALLCKAKTPQAGAGDIDQSGGDNEHLNTEIECNLVDAHRRAVYARKGVLGDTREMTAELISEHLQLSVGSL